MEQDLRYLAERQALERCFRAAVEFLQNPTPGKQTLLREAVRRVWEAQGEESGSYADST